MSGIHLGVLSDQPVLFPLWSVPKVMPETVLAIAMLAVEIHEKPVLALGVIEMVPAVLNWLGTAELAELL